MERVPDLQAGDAKECDSCRESFEPKQWFQRFCSDKCRQRDLRKRKRAAKKQATGTQETEA